jgi:hypothetical protein
MRGISVVPAAVLSCCTHHLDPRWLEDGGARSMLVKNRAWEASELPGPAVLDSCFRARTVACHAGSTGEVRIYG